MKQLDNNAPVAGENSGCVPYKWWQYLPPFKSMHDYTRRQNLGQTYEGVPKYKSQNSKGHQTGPGYAFEDLHAKERREAGHEMVQVPPRKNGEDFIDNGKKVQLKYGRDGASIVRSLYMRDDKDVAYGGEMRYPGQRPVVPAGKKRFVEKHIENRKANGFTDNYEEVEESNVTCEEVEAYTFKGKESFKMDMKDTNLIVPAAVAGLVVGAVTGCVVSGVIDSRLKNGKKMTLKHKLLAGGLGLVTAGVSAAGFLAAGCAARQDLRPERMTE